MTSHIAMFALLNSLCGRNCPRRPLKNILFVHPKTVFEQMRGEAVPKRVGVHAFLDPCSFGGLFTRIPNCFRIGGLISTVIAVAWK
jgi:hypothetical protein